jgi:hypothetical protein
VTLPARGGEQEGAEARVVGFLREKVNVEVRIDVADGGEVELLDAEKGSGGDGDAAGEAEDGGRLLGIEVGERGLVGANRDRDVTGPRGRAYEERLRTLLGREDIGIGPVADRAGHGAVLRCSLIQSFFAASVGSLSVRVPSLMFDAMRTTPSR